MTTRASTLFKATLLITVAALAIALTTALGQKEKAPELTFTTLTGQQISMQSLRGKVVMVNFWATSCGGCIAEMPTLVKTYNDYHPKGVELIAVAMAYDPPNHVLAYTTQHRLPFPVMHDGLEQIANQFKDVRLTPTTFIIDKQGQIIRTIIGEVNSDDLQKTLDAALQEAS